MLTAEKNRLITETGPGTRCGALSYPVEDRYGGNRTDSRRARRWRGSADPGRSPQLSRRAASDRTD